MITGSIESLLKDWPKNTLLFTAGSALSYALLPSRLAYCSLTALGILLASEGARKFQLNRYFKVADVELYAVTKFFLSKFQGAPVNVSSDKPAILFLHGMLGFGNNGRWLLENLKPHASVYQIDMGTVLASTLNVGYEAEIKRCAALVEKKIRSILKETGQTQITVVGHSRGGVIASEVATSTGLIKRVFTLCSPQKLKLNGGESDETVKKADYMNALYQKVKQTANVHFTHFNSQVDLITTENEKLSIRAIEGCSHIRIEEFDSFGHVGAVYSEAVLREITKELQ